MPNQRYKVGYDALMDWFMQGWWCWSWVWRAMVFLKTCHHRDPQVLSFRVIAYLLDSFWLLSNALGWLAIRIGRASIELNANYRGACQWNFQVVIDLNGAISQDCADILSVLCLSSLNFEQSQILSSIWECLVSCRACMMFALCFLGMAWP